MRKLYLCVIAFLLLTKAHSQKDTFTIGRNQIHFSPLRIIDIVNPGVELSYERLFRKQYSTEISAAYLFDPFPLTFFSRFHGYRLAVEEKHFFRMKNTHKTYVAAEAVYNHVHFGYYLDDSNDSMYVHKYTATLNLRYGWQTYFNKHLLLDINFGAGVRYFNTQAVYYQLSNVDNLPGVRPGISVLYDMASRSGHYFTVNIPFTIKIGYSF